jgi:transmembrane sensor
MSGQPEKIADAGKHIAIELTEARLVAMERRLAEGLRRSRIRRKQGLLILAAATVLFTVLAVSRTLIGPSEDRVRSASTIPPNAAKNPENGPGLRFDDGSLVTPLGESQIARLSEASDQNRRVRVASGRAHFEVAKQNSGTFEVLAGHVRVEVIGTAFDVEVREYVVRVSVSHGVVKVHSPTESVLVHEGESMTFRASEPEVKAPPTESTEPRRVEPPTSSAKASGPEWRHLAKDGDFEKAYNALASQPSAVRDEPGDLLLAADVQRLSGHPRGAVAPLQRVVSKFPADPRAPLAAFTLGRVLLDEVGDPRGAAVAFEAERRLQPGGPLDESSLARAIEAWSRAGESQRARTLAEEYFRRYPNGSKSKIVRKYSD